MSLKQRAQRGRPDRVWNCFSKIAQPFRSSFPTQRAVKILWKAYGCSFPCSIFYQNCLFCLMASVYIHGPLSILCCSAQHFWLGSSLRYLLGPLFQLQPLTVSRLSVAPCPAAYSQSDWLVPEHPLNPFQSETHSHVPSIPPGNQEMETYILC